MRLIEVAPNFVQSQTGTFLTILRHLEDRLGKGIKVPLPKIVKLMNNVGYSFSYDDLKDLYDRNPNIAELISNFNEKEVTIGKADDSVSSDEPDSSQMVDKMAKSAAKKINQ